MGIQGFRSYAIAVGLIGGLVSPGAAQAGFFEQLFGMQPVPQPAPSYGYGYEQAPRAPRVQRRKRVAADTGKQKPTDLMHDATLRQGDAVMMKSGVHIYEGDRASVHESDEFVALDDAADVSRKQREALLALDTTRNDPLRGNFTPDTLASGRSASVSAPISPGYRITDTRGRSVRYVGP